MAQAAARRARRERAAGPVAVALAVGLALVGATAGCAGPATDATAGDEQAQALAAPGTADPTAAPELTAPSPEPMVTASPDAFSQVGDLVEGFPIDLLPVPSDSVILVTSAVPVGDADVQEDSLNLRTSATAAEVRAHLADLATEVVAVGADDRLAQALTVITDGGKRLRAAFCYWSWRANGGDPASAVPGTATRDDVLAIGAALELFQAAALLHDDVMDDSDTRRGRPAAHRHFAEVHAALGWSGPPGRTS